MCDDLRSEAKRRIVALKFQFLLLGLFGHVRAIGRAKRVTSRIHFARASGKSERRQDLQKQAIIIGNMLSCGNYKPRVALRMILRVYRSVFASTLVLTAISSVIVIALCAVTQPGNWDHLHRGYLLIALTSVASVTTGMRRVPLIACYPSLL
jgi:hypothetical protein